MAEMPSDRETKEFCATKVMGWTLEEWEDDGFDHPDAVWRTGAHGLRSIGWDPLTSIADAFEVIAAVSGKLKTFRRFEVHVLTDCVCAMIATGTGDVDEQYPFQAEAKEAPRAITLAAYRAMGGQE